jgi:hypothetical protein
VSVVAVAGSDADPFFVVIDFSDPDRPVVTPVAPDPKFPFGACRVAIDQTTVVAGDSQGSDIRLLDVSEPARPVTLGFFRTNLAGIAAINILGSRVVVGELFSASTARVLLIEFSSPANPRILGSAAVPFASGGSPPQGPPQAAAISSVAFLSEHVVLVSGPNQLQISLIDFSVPANPQLTNFSPTRLIGPPAIDAKNEKFAVGDSNGSHVKLFDAGLNPLADFATKLFPVSQVALSDSFILATSSEDALVSCIPLDGRPVQSVNAGLGLGLFAAVDGTMGVCGATNNTFLRLIDLNPNPPTLFGPPANAQLSSLTTLGLSSSDSPGRGGGGGGQGQGGNAGGVIPAGGGGGDFLTRPFGCRAIMISNGLKPEKGMRMIRPAVVSVAEFVVDMFEGIIRFRQ